MHSGRRDQPAGRALTGCDISDNFCYLLDNCCITELRWLLGLAASADGQKGVASVTLIQGGYGNRDRTRRRAQARRAQRRRTARAVAPLLIPIALAITLGVILAVSAGAPTAHVNQQQSTTTGSTQP